MVDMVVDWRDVSEESWIGVCRGSAVQSRHRRDIEHYLNARLRVTRGH